MLTLAIATTLVSIFITFTAVNNSAAGKAWLVTAVLYLAWWLG